MTDTSNSKTILLTGSTGFIGTALAEALVSRGYRVIPLHRSETDNQPEAKIWAPQNNDLKASLLHGVDVIIHLGGASIAGGRWTTKRKQLLWNSRIDSTRVLAQALKNHAHSVNTFICASAAGYYGHQMSKPCDESSPPTEDFLSQLCVAWEGEANHASSENLRVLQARFGLVLDKEGGFLKTILPPFRAGIGGRLGSGKQMMSCISRTDAVRAIIHLLETSDLSGPVNIVGPQPVTNQAFTEILGKTLKRPALLPVPKVAMKLLMGRDMASALPFGSMNVIPKKLLQSSFKFQHPTVHEQLAQTLTT